MSTVNHNDSGTLSSVVTTETSNSVEKHIKLLCSYGGNILPRPFDGQLKYVGGETRVVRVPSSISFLDLIKKIEDIFKVGIIVIKYRIMNEDLDTLVSVRCDDDLVHLWEEHDRLMSLDSSTTLAPRLLRLFLVGSLSVSRVHNYLDAVNGQQMYAPSNFYLEPSREYHAESSYFCNVDDTTKHHLELPTTVCGVSSPHQKHLPRVWSAPNLHGAHQIGGDGAVPSFRTQCDHLYQNPVQLHQQACRRYDACQCGNVCGYPLPTPVKRPLIRVSSYQNLNLNHQACSVASGRIGSNIVQNLRTIGNGVQISIPNSSGPRNLIPSNILQNTMANNISMQKPVHNCVCVQNPIPTDGGVQNLISSTKHLPLEVGTGAFAQPLRSGSATLVGEQSRASTHVSEGFNLNNNQCRVDKL